MQLISKIINWTEEKISMESYQIIQMKRTKLGLKVILIEGSG